MRALNPCKNNWYLYRLLPASIEDRDFILNGVKDGFKLSVIYGPQAACR
jgi:hypothetical protein